MSLALKFALVLFLLHQRYPDLVIYLDVAIKTALERISKRGSFSLFEKEDFLKRVKNGYSHIFKNRTNVIIINGNDSLEVVHEIAFNKVLAWLKTHKYLS